VCVDPVPFMDHSEGALAREGCRRIHVHTYECFPLGVSQVFQTIRIVSFNLLSVLPLF